MAISRLSRTPGKAVWLTGGWSVTTPALHC